jgi:hypothetical protein
VKRVGPELKMPDLKNLEVPGVVRDLYRDLRDRRLLPLVALALVALVAVPFLLGDSNEAPPPAAGSVAENPTAAISSAELTVVKAAPGLREPRKRLKHLDAKDPFKQHYVNAPVAPDPTAVSSTSTASSTSGSGVPVEGATSTPPTDVEVDGQDGGTPPGNSGDPGGGGGAPDTSGLVFYAFAVDVKIVRTETKPDGSKESSELPTRERVLPATSLPGEKQQVVTYMGISPKTHNPLFLVSTDVSAVFGDAKCVTGSDSCQLLELEEGLPETFMYGANDVRFKLTVLDIEPVVTGHS